MLRHKNVTLLSRSCEDPLRVMEPHFLARFALSLTVAVGLSCGQDSSPPAPADGGDASIAQCMPRPPFETGSADGAPMPLVIPPGGVRAGRLSATELPTDRTGLAEWKAGDYVLANERVAVLIEAARPSSGYDPWGGHPVGIARVENGRLVAAGDFGEVIFGLGRFTLQTESVTVMQDGASGVAAVRAVGVMRPVPFIDEFARAIAPTDYADVRAAIDYELRPGADHVDVYVTYDSPVPYPRTVQVVTHAFFQGYRMGRFFPGMGFNDGNAPSNRTIGWVDDDGMSWAWQVPASAGVFTPLLSVSGFDGFRAPNLNLAACSRDRVHAARMVLGRGLDGLQRALSRIDERSTREVRGTVTEAGGSPAQGVRVHALGLDGMTYLTRAKTDAMGNYALNVPAGVAVQLRAFRPGDAITAPVMVAADTGNAAIALAPTGTIRVTATDPATLQGIPVRVQVTPVMMEGSPTVLPPDHWGEPMPGRGRLHVEFPMDGRVEMRAPAGRYRVVVSRGFEYEISDTTVTVTVGVPTEVSAPLRRSIETTGALCGDFHIHTHRSADSGDTGRFKLLAGAGDGVEVMARSEHEYVADFEAQIMEMGLGAWVKGVGSIELTTFTWGHFGVFPLEADATRPNGGTFAWANRRPPEVFADVRARRENPTLVINHPRGGMQTGSYFDAAGYDRTTGRASREGYWDERFTAVEFFNSASFEEAHRPDRDLVGDWFSFLNRGRRVFAVGSSDSHGVNPNSPVGYPRTCMLLGTDAPRMASPQAIGTAVGTGRSVISGGIYLDVEASPSAGGTTTAGPGQELTGAGATARVRIRAQAPAWVNAQRLEVFVDGASVMTIPLTDATRDPMNAAVRYRGEVTVPVAAGGSWVVVAAHGAELLPVFAGNQAFGVSNPIFLRR